MSNLNSGKLVSNSKSLGLFVTREHPMTARGARPWRRFPLKLLFVAQSLLAVSLLVWQQTSKPIGLEGYCPVTLIESHRWQLGNPRYRARYEGQSFYFVGEEEREVFMLEPAMFAPVLGGNDAVHFCDTGQLVRGVRSYGIQYNQRVYLFKNEQSLRRFAAEYLRYAIQDKTLCSPRNITQTCSSRK